MRANDSPTPAQRRKNRKQWDARGARNGERTSTSRTGKADRSHVRIPLLAPHAAKNRRSQAERPPKQRWNALQPKNNEERERCFMPTMTTRDPCGREQKQHQLRQRDGQDEDRETVDEALPNQGYQCKSATPKLNARSDERLLNEFSRRARAEVRAGSPPSLPPGTGTSAPPAGTLFRPSGAATLSCAPHGLRSGSITAPRPPPRSPPAS